MSISIAKFNDNAKLAYSTNEVKQGSSSYYQTHLSPVDSLIYKIAGIFTQPAKEGIYWSCVQARKGSGFGQERGPGGVSKRFAWIKAAAWLTLTLITLPLIILGIIVQQIMHPQSDKIRFLDASKDLKYTPPKLKKDDELHLATYNVACLPKPVDAMKDVLPAKDRMHEFAKWLHKQNTQDLPLVLGLQEAFDQDASEVFTNETRDLYPYAVTSAGWSSIPFLGSNSGLQFHSRVPILSAEFHPFDDLVGFGVKCSARGFLRVELDLGEGNTTVVYVTHTQAHTEPEETKVRKQELELIRDQMIADQRNDIKANVCRMGYFLMGDLNVSNVDDEKIQTPSRGIVNEYEDLHKQGEVLSNQFFYDPYLEDHDTHGKRTCGTPKHLEGDVGNTQRLIRNMKKIKEPKGSFYYGPTQTDRGPDGYGTKSFHRGSHPVVKDCRFDYILRLQDSNSDIEGRAEIRHVISEKIKTSPLSDHALVSARFFRKKV